MQLYDSQLFLESCLNRCNSGVKDLVAVPPIGTRVSFFERSLLGPNSARLSPGLEGNTVTKHSIV